MDPPPPGIAPLATFRTLVLDAAWQPLLAIGWQRAISLGLSRRVEVLEYYDRLVRTTREAFPLPAVVRARRHVSKHPGQVALTRRNVLIRDAWRCQYCDERPGHAKLTLDHVLPSSRGGRSTWQNLVTCCAPCNSRKGSRTPTEAGMPLLRVPKMPSPFELGRDGLELSNPPPEWCDYLVRRAS